MVVPRLTSTVLRARDFCVALDQLRAYGSLVTLPEDELNLFGTTEIGRAHV